MFDLTYHHIMKRLFRFVLPLLFICPIPLNAETAVYRLGISLVSKGINAGTGVYKEESIKYGGADAFRMTMELNTNKFADMMFKMRDTITSVTTLSGCPLHYNKTVNEKNVHNIETADFTSENGNYQVHLLVKNQNGRVISDKRETCDQPVYDMLSMLHFARGIDTSNLTVGKEIKMPLVNGDLVVMQHIIYEGNEIIRDDSGKRHECMRLSVRDYKNGSERETLRVFVTTDSLHIPVRLDIILGAVTVKAVMEKFTE